MPACAPKPRNHASCPPAPSTNGSAVSVGGRAVLPSCTRFGTHAKIISTGPVGRSARRVPTPFLGTGGAPELWSPFRNLYEGRAMAFPAALPPCPSSSCSSPGLLRHMCEARPRRQFKHDLRQKPCAAAEGSRSPATLHSRSHCSCSLVQIGLGWLGLVDARPRSPRHRAHEV
jgi:hypothetical protein